MLGEAKKLYLIEEILKIEDPVVLLEVEALLNKSKLHALKKRSFAGFAGMLTDEEAAELEHIIEEGCENINADDWK
jgi:hypothetical protein